MQTANIILSLGGHHGNTVPKFGVTAAEIAVLRAIHGDESVKDIEPGPTVKTTHRAERERLLGIYGAAKHESGAPIVAGMFPGVAARVHETLEELELPAEFFKAIGHMAPEPAEQTAEAPAETPAPSYGVEEIEDEDGVGEDIHDEHAAKDDILG